VIIIQENRTPDGLFQGLPGADIASTGRNSSGQLIPLAPIALSVHYDIGHTHPDFLKMYDNGKMDGADREAVTCVPGSNSCPLNPQFKYVTASEVAPYLQLAGQYTFADRMFQTNQGPSFPAHQFLISGTSAPTATAHRFAAENPGGVTGAFFYTGCVAPAGETVALIDPYGHYWFQYPCFEHQTLLDLLSANNVTWRYYTPSAGVIWTAPNAIQHLCVPDPTGTYCSGPAWAVNFGGDVMLWPPQILTNIANGKLRDVSWVIPSGQNSDHAQMNDGGGPSWVASIVNAIGNSPYWSNTAIFITWDDWGGWYDHVAPQIINSYEYGFRVPLIVVSPYAKPCYVSHVNHDFGSILKFIEEVYNLPSLGYADANADDLSDCFNFTQGSAAFRSIKAPYDAAYFINDKRTATDPDDD